MTAQYYQKTLKILLDDYRSGLVTIPGLIVEYIRIKFAPGWRVSLSPKKVCSELGIKLGSFYRAIALIVKKKLITRAIHLLREDKILNEEYVGYEKSNDDKENVIHQNENPIHEDENPIHKSEKEIHKDEKEIHKFVKNDPETTSKNKSSSESPDLSSNSYSKFISNLSQSERENFLDFCKRRTDSFDIPLKCSLRTFLAARNKETGISYLAEFWDLYQKEGDVALNLTEKSNTTGMKPNFQKWYYWLKEVGIMVRKYDWRGEIGAIDNCGKSQSFEEWLKIYSMEEAKQRFEASNRWGR